MAQTNTETHTHTDGHCDSMTESGQWGRFSENQQHFINDTKEQQLVVITKEYNGYAQHSAVTNLCQGSKSASTAGPIS